VRELRRLRRRYCRFRILLDVAGRVLTGCADHTTVILGAEDDLFRNLAKSLTVA
jgi:hypothetical protein